MSMHYNPSTRRYEPPAPAQSPQRPTQGYPQPEWIRQTVNQQTEKIMQRTPTATPNGPARRNVVPQTTTQLPPADFPEERAATNGAEPVELEEIGGLTLEWDFYESRTQQYLNWLDETGNDAAIFPQGRTQGIYPRDLLGVAFVITSDLRYSMSQPRPGSQFPSREQAQCMIRFYDPTSGHFSKPRLATLNGSYLLNQTRSIPPDMLIGGMLWTVAPNPFMDDLPNGQKPKMLKVWEVSDEPERDETEDNAPVSAPEPPQRPAATPPVPQPSQPARTRQGSHSAIAPTYPPIPAEPEPVKRGRGRPKGSTNRR